MAAVETAALTAELRSGRVGGKLGVVLLAVSVAYSAIAFADVAHPLGLTLWTAAFSLILLVWLAVLFVPAFRPTEDGEIVRFWLPLVRGLATAANLLVAVSVWLLLPVASPDLRALMTMLYIWFIVVQLMAETRASSVSRSATIMVMGSLVAFEFTHPQPYSVAVGIFLAMFGASMLVFQRLLRRTTLEAIRARLLAEQIGDKLEIALRESEAQRDAITRFLASASHDLQQPVQAASLFFDRAIGGPPPARERAIEGARRAFASAQSLLSNMLEHLRLESGVASPRLQRVALGPLFADLALEQEARAGAANTSIVVVPTHRSALADPALLRRILGNLIVNAVAHSGSARVLVCARRRNGRISVYVIDQGRGIADDLAQQIFDGRSAQAPQSGNLGLGLSSSQRAARAMGGDLNLDHRWRNGACFVVTLDEPPYQSEGEGGG